MNYRDGLQCLHTDELQSLCHNVKDDQNNIIVMMFTKGHIEEALNCITSYYNSTGKQNVIVFALDNETKLAMDTNNISCYYHYLFFQDDVIHKDIGTIYFKKIAFNKLLCIYACLQLQINVLWSDTDIVYFKNPFNRLMEISKDISIQNNIKGSTEKKTCSGFMYYRSTNHSLSFLKKCIEFIHVNYERLLTCGGLADQAILNKFHDDNIMTILPINEFPCGLVWWDNYNTDNWKQDSYMVHNNWITGVDNKIKRFKESGLWFL